MMGRYLDGGYIGGDDQGRTRCHFRNFVDGLKTTWSGRCVVKEAIEHQPLAVADGSARKAEKQILVATSTSIVRNILNSLGLCITKSSSSNEEDGLIKVAKVTVKLAAQSRPPSSKQSVSCSQVPKTLGTFDLCPGYGHSL